ncbi:unnamed protein product [Dibothriocephalus latus]|uniref:Band 7 domain-containing protein n=1 Tax=Dibothriocephalus latus TaxID=60516 RepID=A0A3P7LVZ5_DIBLA|nr:unnamed protein product [Dibothriocephalus latus]
MTWGFVTCGPNEAMVVSGCCHRSPYYVTGGRIFLLPFIQRLDRISLNIMTLIIESPRIYTQKGVPITVTGVAQVKVQGSNTEMLSAACEQFLGKTEEEIQEVAKETLEGHQRAIMGNMTVEEIYKDRKKFSKAVFEVASSDLINMGISVVSYTLKDIKDDQVSQRCTLPLKCTGMPFCLTGVVSVARSQVSPKTQTPLFTVGSILKLLPEWLV